MNEIEIKLLKQQISERKLPVDLNAYYTDSLLNEIIFAVNPPIHERNIPKYASMIVVSKKVSLKHINSIGEIINISKLPEEYSRMLANANQSFYLIIGKKKIILCLKTQLNNEIDYMKFAVANRVFIVQRFSDGEVKIFTDRNIIIYKKNHWIQKEYSFISNSKVFDVLPMNALNNCISIILEFCFHVLSPRNIGATLLLKLNTNPVQSKYLEQGIDIAGLNLNILNQFHSGAIANLIRQNDGAVLIDHNGTVTNFHSTIRNSERSNTVINKFKGTRHTSARRLTYDLPNIIAFVVSEDGPVMVFSDGVNLLNLSEFTPGGDAKSLLKNAPDRKDDICAASEEITCGNCGKKICVEIQTRRGFKETQEGLCPVCNHLILKKACGNVKTKIIKEL
jgi:hypothetical protein